MQRQTQPGPVALILALVLIALGTAIVVVFPVAGMYAIFAAARDDMTIIPNTQNELHGLAVIYAIAFVPSFITRAKAIFGGLDRYPSA